MMITTLMNNYNKDNEKAEGFKKICNGEACYRNSLCCYKDGKQCTINYRQTSNTVNAQNAFSG